MKRNILFALLIAFFAFGLAGARAAETQSASEPVEKAGQTVMTTSAAVTLDLSWLSINGGGASYGAGGTRKIGYSVGQSVAGEGSGGIRKIGIGFWYGAVTCAFAKGDMNGIGGITSADAVAMQNCVYLASGNCDLCFADVNCDGSLTSADGVLELNRVYLGSTAPPWCGI